MAIGKSHHRIDAPGKVTGATLYPADIDYGNMLHAKVVFSDQPHARMLSMDLSKAEAVEGVMFILTAKDVPVNEYGLTLFDQPVIVGLGSDMPHSDISRWEADHIAFIVAETEAAAAQARELIEVEWEQLPILDDMFEALKDQTLLHPRNNSNTLSHMKFRKGDMDAAWAQADVTIEGRYVIPYQEHAYLQPEAGLGYIDDEGRVTVEVAGQWVHEDQMQIAHALGLEDEQVRVIYPAVGGAFGGREDMSIQIVLALAAQTLHKMGIERPVRTIWSREESIVGHHKRHQVVVETRWGATNDGKIVAVEASSYLDAGAYNYTSNKVLGNLHMTVGGPYEIPNAHIDSYAIYTNNVPGGAFRGFGAPQGCFAAEGQMNRLAAALDMDPVEIRMLNCLTDDSISIAQTPMPKGVSLPKVIRACGDAANERQQSISPKNFKSFATLPADDSKILRGRGVACAYKNIGFSFGFPERCEATIELIGSAEIERVILKHAGAEVGQGAHTAFRQMAAEAVGVPFEMVETVYHDTAHAGDSGSASASRLTWMAGNSILMAAEKALEKWEGEERPAVGHARYVPPATTTLDAETGVGDPNFTYGYVAEAVEVAVDIETGHLSVEWVVCANDVGKAINRNLVVGQIEGAVVQAHGYSVTENLQLKNGRILNPRLSTYLIPGIQDIPRAVDSVILEEPDPLGPWGARGMAEMPMIPLAPAIAAALHDATGVWFDQFPFTPVQIIKTLQASAVDA